MPSPAEGLIFGDFTAEEWEKFFKRPAAQFGNSPPVEFLSEFEYSDNEEPNHYDGSLGQKLCDESSSAVRNVTAGPEDSGVEVGQESEQEITPTKPAKQPMGGVKIDDQSKPENAVDDLPQAEPKQDIAEPSSHPVGQGSGPQQIVFAGNSIVKETDPAKKSASAPSSSDISSSRFSFEPSFAILTTCVLLFLNNKSDVYSSEVLNYIRLSIGVVDHCTAALRVVFIESWNHLKPKSHWENDGTSAAELLKAEKSPLTHDCMIQR